jgi:CRP/FNR family transcriptional regulator, cyclic AMP receptor protein
MILLAGIPNLDSSPSALTDTSRRASGRDWRSRDQAPTPPGTCCLRCGGLLVLSYMASLESDLIGRTMRLWCCVKCGDCIDHDILVNRWNGPVPARETADSRANIVFPQPVKNGVLKSACRRPKRPGRTPSPSQSIMSLCYEFPFTKGVPVMANVCSLSAGPRTATMRPPGGISMAATQAAPFNPKTLLAQVGGSRTALQCQKHQILFTQGDTANAVFYIQAGQVKLSVASQQGKEAVIAMLERGNFFGEECLAGQQVCMATATSLDNSSIVRIDKQAMIDALYNEPAFSELFMSHLLTRNLRIQEDLVDQLINSAEKRLARTLLLLATCKKEGPSELVIPRISQGTLAEMVGTTRARVSFFMNRFKKLGFIEYTNGLHVHRASLNAILTSKGRSD